MVKVIVYELDEFSNKNLYTVKEFVSREIAEEYINKDVNPNDDLIAEIHNDLWSL